MLIPCGFCAWGSFSAVLSFSFRDLCVCVSFTRKDEMKSAEFSCGRLELSIKENILAPLVDMCLETFIKQKKKEKNTENIKKELTEQKSILEKQNKFLEEQTKAKKSKAKAEKERLRIEMERLSIEKKEQEIRNEIQIQTKNLRKLMAKMSSEIDDLEAAWLK